MQLARLGVDEVRRQRAGVAAEERVRERAVAPEEAAQMQAREQLDEPVQEVRAQVGDAAAGEERAVGERVLEVARDQHGVQVVAAAGDDPDRLDDRQALPLEAAQERPLAAGRTLGQLLQRVERAVVLDEAHDVAADAADQVDEPLRLPLLERLAPRQVEEVRMTGARDEVEVRRRRHRCVIVELSSASMPPGLATTVLSFELRLGVEVRLDRDAAALRIRRVHLRAGDRVVLDLALRVVEADDPDPVRAEHVVVADRAHRHLAHRDPAQRGLADAVVLDVDHRHVRDDPLAHADDRAALDHAHLLVHRERDVDALHPWAGRARDGAAVDHDARAPHVDAVELGADDVHVLEHDVVRVLDVDAVLAAVHGDVTQRDVVGPDDDAAVDDAADERLRVADHERPLHGAVQVHGRRADAVGGADAAERGRDDRDRRHARPLGRARRPPRRTRAGSAGRARARRPGR